MSEGPATLEIVSEPDVHLDLEKIAPAVALLGCRLPRVRDPAVARQWAHSLHRALVHVATGRGALDIAIGEGLAALNVGLRAINLKYSNINDYAREELGINASTAAKMERLARRLRDLPLIRDAVRRGVITARKAEIISTVAKGNEAFWLLRAKGGTVRSLKAEVSGRRDEDEERWLNLSTRMPGEKRRTLDLGLAVAGMVLEKPTASNSERIEAWCQEYMSTRETPSDEHADDLMFTPDGDLESLKERLEQIHGQWAHLAQAPPRKAPAESGEIDPLAARPGAQGTHRAAEKLGRGLRAARAALSVFSKLGPARVRELRALLRGGAGNVGARRCAARHPGARPPPQPALAAGARRTAAQLRASQAHRPRRRSGRGPSLDRAGAGPDLHRAPTPAA